MTSGIIGIMKRVAEQESRRVSLLELGVVTAVFPHASASDKDNYQCSVRLKNRKQPDGSDFELRRVPVATQHIGLANIPNVGDLVAIGSPDESGGWLVDLPSPITGETVCTIRLVNSAVATSGRDYRQWIRDGQHFHHIIDPRTGHPSTSDILSASVIAPDGVQAEIWAKAALIDSALLSLPTLLFHSDGSMVRNEEFAAQCITETR